MRSPIFRCRTRNLARGNRLPVRAHHLMYTHVIATIVHIKDTHSNAVQILISYKGGKLFVWQYSTCFLGYFTLLFLAFINVQIEDNWEIAITINAQNTALLNV